MAFFENNSTFNGGPGDEDKKRSKAVSKVNDLIYQRNYERDPKKYEKLTGKIDKLKSQYGIVVKEGIAK